MTPTFLDRICEQTRADVDRRKAERPQADIETDCYSVPAPRDFQAALERSQTTAIIAETKKASPSAGLFRADYDPAAIVRVYEAAGATALSVVTEPHFFQGDPDHLRAAKEASRLPILRKDFMLDEYQLYESCALGADAVLLIARLFDDSRLEDMVALAHELSVAALVEVHDLAELERAQRADARIIGINNRDLASFEVNLETTLSLAPRVDTHRLVVSESGIRSSEDVARVRSSGARAVLVGETLMRSADVSATLRGLMGS